MAEFLITTDEVQVWKLNLNDTQAEAEEKYQSLLSEDEIDRAQKLRFQDDRFRFTVARANLRLLLSRYIDKKPRQLWLRYGRHGKPYLSEESNPDRINFNLSHSHIAGGSVRISSESRYRQWFSHKLASWQDQFDTLGCTGCGRCITWCPVGIDITEEAKKLQALPKEEKLN